MQIVHRDLKPGIGAFAREDGDRVIVKVSTSAFSSATAMM